MLGLCGVHKAGLGGAVCRPARQPVLAGTSGGGGLATPAFECRMDRGLAGGDSGTGGAASRFGIRFSVVVSRRRVEETRLPRVGRWSGFAQRGRFADSVLSQTHLEFGTLAGSRAGMALGWADRDRVGAFADLRTSRHFTGTADADVSLRPAKPLRGGRRGSRRLAGFVPAAREMPGKLVDRTGPHCGVGSPPSFGRPFAAHVGAFDQDAPHPGRPAGN